MLEAGSHISRTMRIMLLGAGELGRELAIAAIRLGLEVIACDRYDGAPAMQVALRIHVFDLQNSQALRAIVEQEKPDFVVPELEAISTDALLELERAGWNIVPGAYAVATTMNRAALRQLAAQTLGFLTSKYAIVRTKNELAQAAAHTGFPCLLKPSMSSSGKGQSLVKSIKHFDAAWERAFSGSRGRSTYLMLESFVPFDFEITLLTIRTRREGTQFCQAIGHRQEDGDFVESWQPQTLSLQQLSRCQEMAKAITDALGGYGLFGVEFFIVGDEVFFNEVSPRPHDTGFVTLVSQVSNQFELHLRAFLDLPLGSLHLHRFAAATALRAPHVHGGRPTFAGVDQALMQPETNIHLFGKPSVYPKRRLGVALASGIDVEQARTRAQRAARTIHILPTPT